MKRMFKELCNILNFYCEKVLISSMYKK